MKVYRDPLLKMVHNPGGDWHPGKGDNPRYNPTYRGYFTSFITGSGAPACKASENEWLEDDSFPFGVSGAKCWL